MTGTFHHVSEQHLDRYIDEFAFRYNRREITDAERTVHALKKVGGKRLTPTRTPRRVRVGLESPRTCVLRLDFF